MTEPGYPAARAIAATVEKYFEQQLSVAREQGQEELAAGPDARVIEKIIDAAFWASLRREEGHPPTISLAFLPPEQADRPLTFERRLPLAPATLTQLAPAVERPGIHLGVWHDRDSLFVWGATRAIPRLCFVLEVVEPGLLVIKHRRGGEFGKFTNVAVLQGDQVKLVDQSGGDLSDCPPLVAARLGFEAPASWSDSLNVLVQLAASMRAHGRGGSLLVVPHGTEEWRESIVHPIRYSIAPPFSRLAELMREDAEARQEAPWQEALRRLIDGLAGLTAVDGATLISDRYDLLAFGVKIERRAGNASVEQLVVTEPVLGRAAEVVYPAEVGGTRHLSAAQFVHDQRDALALVASQDGRFTVFAWSPCEERVHAHRVETLLL
ncbi:MAG: putative sensor domain DACNV-containing protein [Longimicrobiaceae bacterium]